MSAREPWEDEGEEWRAQGDGAPDYTLPPGTWPGDVVYCPKCVSENRSRRERKEKPLDPVAIIRRRDDAIFCLRHQETFYRSFARWISHLPVLPD